MFDGLEDEARYCLALAAELAPGLLPEGSHCRIDVVMLAGDLLRIRNILLFFAEPEDEWDVIDQGLSRLLHRVRGETTTSPTD